MVMHTVNKTFQTDMVDPKRVRFRTVICTKNGEVFNHRIRTRCVLVS